MAALHLSLSSIFLLTTQTLLCDTTAMRATRLLQKQIKTKTIYVSWYIKQLRL